jgi:hypothetical protein
MVTCSKCSKSFSKERQKLGYTICLSCSIEEKKVGHVVYPHKTGAYVQPVSSDTAKRLNQLDRRGYKRQSGYRMPKTISSESNNSSTSHDKKYISKINHLSTTQVYKNITSYFCEWGFSRTMDYIRQLNIKGKIPLKVRSEWEGKICDMYVNM